MYKSIQKKLILYIFPMVFIILIFGFYLSMTNSKTIVQQEIFDTIEAKKEEQSNAIESAILQIKGTADIFASSVGSTYEYLDADIYNAIITNMLSKDAKLRSAGVWFEPYIADENQKYLRYFVQNLNGDFIVNENYNNTDFDYFNYELYIRCKELNEGFFSEGTYHELLDTYTIMYVTPIQNPEGEFIGCITTSFDIDQLKALVDSYNNDIFNFYITDSLGVYLAHSDVELVKSRANILDSGHDNTENAETILSTPTGALPCEIDGEEYYVYYDTVSEFEWKIICEIPASYVNKPLLNITLMNINICIAVIAIIISLILYVSNRFVHTPLQLLLGEFKNISNNKFDSDIPDKLLNTDTEFSDIGEALIEMKSNLTNYQSTLEHKNKLLVDNEKTLKNTVDYINKIIHALPIMMFVFDRNGYCIEMHGKLPFENRTKDYYTGKHYADLITENLEQCEGLKEFLNAIKTIDYSDGVVYKKVSPFINGKKEHFEHNLTLCGDDVIISLCRRITDTVNHIQDIEYLSDFDELTGLHNSRYFIDMIKRHVENSSTPISIIVCDINGFKALNDKYGYENCDKLLVDFTSVLNTISVDNKTVARVAGDEFSIILPNTTREDAENIIEEINSMCLLGKISEIPFSIAYGVDTATTEEDSLLFLIKSAEELMYKQKIYTSSGKKDNSIGLINSILLAKNKRERLHSDRVSELCLEMAKALGWSTLEQNKISTAGLLHDIGKIGIHEQILNKPGQLTEEEYKEICTHPEVGYRILESFENMKELAEYAYSHHEKWDGSGYPRKLKGNDIPIESRILAIADTYDAMTSSRSYRDGLPKEVAIVELIKCKNTQFDPELVDIFIEKVLLEKLEDYQS